MKTTMVIDQRKLERVMKLTGIKTRRKAIDFALDQAQHVAQVLAAFKGGLFLDSKKDIIDPNYDLGSMRELDRPRKTACRTK